MTLKRVISLFLIWLTVISFLPLAAAPIARAQDPAATTDEPDGLRFRLSEGSEKVEPTTPNPVVTAESLSEVEIQKLLARLPKLQPQASDEVNFRLRENSLPPPRAGQTIAAAFAPLTTGSTPPTFSNVPLEITRSTPEGEVALAPTLSITFSQPMVAVSSQEEAALHVPVTLSPQPSGKWRWLGTQTLLFQPDAEGGRLPMATSYKVSIPAGTKSALGNTLRETKTFSFATPPPTLKSSYPGGESQPRDPLMFLEFDQRIDAAQVLERLRLQPDNARMRLRMATAEEIAADSAVNALVKQAQEGRWLVVRSVGPDGTTKNALPPDTNVRVVILAGTPSAEGPRTTAKEQSLTFKTFGALRVTEKHCGYESRCSPFDSFNFSFSNQLDDESFQPQQVKISPEIPDVKISQSYNRIEIEGAKLSNTTYTVTLDRTIKDKFGQTLSGETEHTFKVTTADPTLFTTGDGFVVLDPAVRRAFTIYSLNHPRLNIQIYKVTPDEWPQFRRYQAGRSGNAKATPPPGKLVSDKIIEVKAGIDELIETAIDLSPALNEGGYGQVFVKAEPVQRPEDRNKPVNVYAYRQNKVEAWVQSTEIGLDAFADKKELVAWANSLSDGRPLDGVDLRVSADSIMGTTGADGLARLAFKLGPKTKREGWSSLLVARRGNDLAILPPTYYSHYYDEHESGSWQRDDSSITLSWYVIDDRKMYRPGDEVNVKGWIRKIDLTPGGSTGMFSAAGEE